MRSYGQYCAVAKTLDVVGDRWSLLIVRELLLRDACRYTDLRNGLPGIATNLLTDRLRDLERGGVIEREEPKPPVATTLFRLTERGRALRPAIEALGLWGVPMIAEGPAEGDEFRSHWLAFPVGLHLRDNEPNLAPIAIEVRTGDHPVVIETIDGAVHTRSGSADAPDGVLAGPPWTTLGVLTGRLSLAEAKRRGVTYEGDPDALRRVQPRSRRRELATS